MVMSMPELTLIDGNGRLKDDALGVVVGTMYFPNPADANKREQIARWMWAEKEYLLRRWYGEEEYPYPLTFEMLSAAVRGKELTDIVGDNPKYNRDGIIAGNWLTFRLFGAAHFPVLNATKRWVDYASVYLMPNMPQSKRWRWPEDRTSLRSTVRKYGPVAHLWAASTGWFFKLGEDAESIRDPSGLSMLRVMGLNRFLSRAQGYLKAAIEAGLYDEDSLVPLDRVWTLPPQVEATPPDLSRPDKFIELDYERLIEEYVDHDDPTRPSKASRQRAVGLRLYEPPAVSPPPQPKEAETKVQPVRFRRFLPPRQVTQNQQM